MPVVLAGASLYPGCHSFPSSFAKALEMNRCNVCSMVMCPIPYAAILDHGGDVLEYPHAGPKLVGWRRKHAHTADIRRFVKTFQGLLEIAP